MDVLRKRSGTETSELFGRFLSENERSEVVATRDGDGFWLYLKRLEKGRFRWAKADDGELTMILTAEEFANFLGSTKVAQKLKREDLKFGKTPENISLPPLELERRHNSPSLLVLPQ